MDQHRYVQLRPAPSEARAEPDGTSSLGPLESKRRRIGVSVACNACRRKKIRCDGQHPTCSPCHDQQLPCEYREKPPLLDETNKLLVEVFRILNNLPRTEVLRVLETMRGESDASTILSTLRGGMEAKQRPSDLSTAAAIMGNTFEVLELEAQNPVAYPSLPPFDAGAFRSDPYRRLTEPAVGASHLLSSINPEQSILGTTEAHHQTVGSPSWERERASPFKLCDSRLRNLNIKHWTNVNIGDDVAARCISLYLETDHPLLGHFDPELFVLHLTTQRHEHCSSLLVNALLYWACQMYSAIDPQTDELTARFCAEAERCWEMERGTNSTVNIAAAQFLSLGYLGQGRDHAVLQYLGAAYNMGIEMGLFDVEDGAPSIAKLTGEAKCAHMYAAWGVFNWISLLTRAAPVSMMSLFYHQPGLHCPRYPPRLPIPDGHPEHETDGSNSPHMTHAPALPAYMGRTFPHLCQFWRIMFEVGLVYYADGKLPSSDSSSSATLRFAEYKFRELLAWSNNLPLHLSRNGQSPHHVQILQTDCSLWFHAAVLDIFRPCVQGFSQSRRRLWTFSSPGSSPAAVCAASVAHLKRLIIDYRLNYESSTYTILWHTALVYVANAILHNTKEEGWFCYFLLCVYGYERLCRSWRVTEAIFKGLLSMTLRNGDISSLTARKILRDLQGNSLVRVPGRIRATFMIDLDLALSDPGSATAENLAEHFEDNALLQDYTNVLDEEMI
ncbi:N-terminal fungal transcription regulatory domain-containing protein [Tolypocladium capitatum]|uniref:N-terminal fungal transcription regulatory domain-containing protein n=1 Tax=Tolypocladium capitatum TaxID=45235 RepID=A0A2K3QCH2_9HYPO|nr:N-terminal fungal transcription regulatory domain-containing protein [Tolypocladium capitatum]